MKVRAKIHLFSDICLSIFGQISGTNLDFALDKKGSLK